MNTTDHTTQLLASIFALAELDEADPEQYARDYWADYPMNDEFAAELWRQYGTELLVLATKHVDREALRLEIENIKDTHRRMRKKLAEESA